MRRIIFVTGLAVGFVLGARAGRERYEQLIRLARKAADSPAVQQAAAAAQAQATGLARSAKDRVVERVPRVAGSARSRIGGKLPGSRPGRSHTATSPSPDGQSYAGSPNRSQP